MPFDADDYAKYPGDYVVVPDEVFETTAIPVSNWRGRKLQKQYHISYREIVKHINAHSKQRIFRRSRHVVNTHDLLNLSSQQVRDVAEKYSMNPARLLNRVRKVRRRKNINHDCPSESSEPNDAEEEEEEEEEEVMTPSTDKPAGGWLPDLTRGDNAFDAMEDRGYLRAVVDRTTVLQCPSLCLLAEVQREQLSDSPGTEALRHRLELVPLAALDRFIQTVSEARDAWRTHVAIPAAETAAGALTNYLRARDNAVLFHVCLWQRRYPLDVAATVLSLYTEGRAFPHTHSSSSGGVSTTSAMEAMMEHITKELFPALDDVPWLVRCDVLMTYPHMPIEEQMKLMADVCCASRKGASAYPVEPQVLLSGYLRPEEVPPRGILEMTHETYRVLRQAFERHKVDGVRRLCHRLYDL